MKKVVFLFSFISVLNAYSQNITGTDLLEKAIAYHDPDNNWPTFQSSFFITMKTPKSTDRNSTINIDLVKDSFYVKAIKDSTTTEYTIEKEQCTIALNGIKNPSSTLKDKHKLSCKRANMYKNYYTYLYGLPMKLKDKGTIIHEKVELKKFKQKEYLVLKVTYDKNVGDDTWYFYFDPKTYAMEVYQFFHDEAKNDGEYIILTKEEIINGIKMPKNRAWYYNTNDKYLGTDILQKSL